MLVESYSSPGWGRDPTVRAQVLADFVAGSKIGDFKGAAGKHQAGREIVGVDGDGIGMIAGDCEYEGGCFGVGEGVHWRIDGERY